VYSTIRIGCSIFALGAALVGGVAHADEIRDEQDRSALLDTITVTGTRVDPIDVGGSVQVLTQEDLRVFSYSDVNRILRQVPGVFLQEEDGFGLRPNIGIRGSGTDRSARVAIMEDGVLKSPAAYSAPAAYYFPRMARIAGIEVAKGPAAIKYGPATIGGAINFFSTPIPDVPAGTVAANLTALAGSYDSQRLHGWAGGWTTLGGGIEIGALVEGLYEHSDGFKRLDIGGSTGFQIQDYTAKLGLRSTDGRHGLELKYQRYDERSDETYLGLTLADFAVSPNRRYNGSQLDEMNVSHETYQLTHSVEFAPRFSLTTIAYRTDTARSWYKLNDVRNAANTGWSTLADVLANPAANPLQFADLVGADGFTGRPGALRVRDNNRVYQTTGVQSVLSAGFDTGSIGHTLELSARYHEDSEDRFQQDDRYQIVDGRMRLTTPGAPGSQDNRIGNARAWAFFVRDTIEAGPLTIVPGLRYETIRLRQTRWALGDTARATPTAVVERTVDVFIPGISASVALSDDIRIVGGAHRGFTNPAPGSSVDIETSWNYEAGVKFGRDGWRAEVIGFFNDYENLVATCTASTGGNCDIGDQFDGNAVDVKGIEVLAGRTLGTIADHGFEMPVSVAYTYTDARFKTAFASGYAPWGNVEANDRLPYLPSHQIAVNAGVAIERARLNATLNWVSKARATAGQGRIAIEDRIDDRALVDLSAEVDLVPGIAAFGSVQNLFDVTYNAGFSPSGARPGAPRLAMAGLRARF
jgi:Fe(3+) dicitrate transport protein